MSYKPSGCKNMSKAREAQAIELRLTGMRYREIGERIGVSESQAYRIVDAGLTRMLAEPADKLRKAEVARLDILLEEAMRQLRMDHVMVSHGKVIPGVIDEGAKLAALDRALRIQERRARLLGLDAPTRHEVITTDAVDAEIARLEAELTDASGPPR